MTPKPITAGKLAERLLQHPESVVQLALPDDLFVLGVGTHLPNEDGTLEPPCENGVFMLVINIGNRL